MDDNKKVIKLFKKTTENTMFFYDLESKNKTNLEKEFFYKFQKIRNDSLEQEDFKYWLSVFKDEELREKLKIINQFNILKFLISKKEWKKLLEQEIKSNKVNIDPYLFYLVFEHGINKNIAFLFKEWLLKHHKNYKMISWFKIFQIIYKHEKNVENSMFINKSWMMISDALGSAMLISREKYFDFKFYLEVMKENEVNMYDFYKGFEWHIIGRVLDFIKKHKKNLVWLFKGEKFKELKLLKNKFEEKVKQGGFKKTVKLMLFENQDTNINSLFGLLPNQKIKSTATIMLFFRIDTNIFDKSIVSKELLNEEKRYEYSYAFLNIFKYYKENLRKKNYAWYFKDFSFVYKKNIMKSKITLNEDLFLTLFSDTINGSYISSVQLYYLLIDKLAEKKKISIWKDKKRNDESLIFKKLFLGTKIGPLWEFVNKKTHFTYNSRNNLAHFNANVNLEMCAIAMMWLNYHILKEIEK